MQRKLLAIASAALLCGAASSMAATISVGGLNLDTGPIFSVGSVYQNVANSVGDELTGVGEVTQINGVPIASMCAGCELTYQFGGYTVTDVSETGLKLDGGWYKFYLGFGADNDLNPFGGGNSSADLAAATNGTLFLSLTGHAVDAAGNTLSVLGRNINTSAPVGFAAGLLDVDTASVGLANAFLDSDSVAAGFGGGNADLQVGTSFSSLLQPHAGECPGGAECVAGSANFRAIVPLVPEPGTYALMLAGLGAMGFVARRRRR